MALVPNFYQDIQKKEQKWINLIEKKLLNVYYFKIELAPFYNKIFNELTYEYNLTNNKIIGQIIEEVKSIINKLDEFETAYRNGKEIDIQSLIPLFLINKLNNNVKKQDNESLDRLQIRRQVLKAVKEHYDSDINKNLNDDYLYEDFPEEQKKII